MRRQRLWFETVRQKRVKLEHWLLKVTLRVRKQKDKISNIHTREQNGNDVCRVDMAVTLADCVDTSAVLDVTFCGL